MDGMKSDDGEYLWPDGYPKVVRIVLTISHTDHDIANNGTPGSRPNLRALCQQCHLRHDHEIHKANAAKTRKRKAGLQDLFQ